MTTRKHNKYLIISDLHLGAGNCNTEAIEKVLATEIFDVLIISGDLFDNHNLKRFKSSQWKVLSTIRKISKEKHVILLSGNHFENVELLSAIIGMDFQDEYNFESGDKKIHIEHGHLQDYWMHRPILTEISTGLFYLIQLCEPRHHRFSRWIKAKVKSWFRVTDHLVQKAYEYGIHNGFNVVIYSHTHYAEQWFWPERELAYYNTGSFCERNQFCSYITIHNGHVTLKHI